MANFFTRALDKITPWNRGGEVQRSLQAKKKKKDEEQNAQNQTPGLQVRPTRSNQQVIVQNTPKPQQPVNVFDANKNLMLGQNKPGVVSVFKNPDVQPMPTMQPGLVVRPTAQKQDITLPDGSRLSEKPRTVEDDINDGLNAGKSWEQIARETRLDVNDVKSYSESTRPNYGIGPIAKPKQSFGNRFRDFFDANTESDKFRRQEGNVANPGENKNIVLKNPGNIVSRTPVVGHVTKTLNTLAGQAAEIPATIEGMVLSKVQTDLTKEMLAAQKRGDRRAYDEAKRKLEVLGNEIQKTNAQQEAGHDTFEKNKGGLFNAGTLYDEEASQRGDIKSGVKDIAIPTAVAMLDLYTLGKGNAITEGVKQGGFRAGVRSQVPNIVKATAGNYASGDLSARGEGASNEQAIKSGILNSILGIIPDIGLPALTRGFRNKIIPSFMRGRGVPPKAAIEELDDAALSASAEATIQATRPRPIPIRQNIPIDEIIGDATNIPVRTIEKAPGNLIQEITGDAVTATPNSVIADNVTQIRRAEADAINRVAVPDRTVEGINPGIPSRPFSLTPEVVATGQAKVVDDYADMLRSMGEGNGTQLVPDGEGGYLRTSNNFRPGDTGGKRMSKAAWREEAQRQLEAGEAEPSVQSAFNDAADPEVQALLTKGEQPDTPVGSPITVKQSTTIPVTNQTVIPTGLPETPGTVRATVATAPANAEAVAVAAQTPAVILPKETQNILDNPKQFNKRQVAAARNQRKLSRQMAKTQEQTAEALDRIETASPAAASGEGFVPTGEFGKSVNGGAIQKVSRASEMAQAVEETSQMSPGDVLKTARENQMGTGGFNRRDIRNIAALFESKRLPRGSTEWNEARQILKEDGTVWGQTGALRNYTLRRTATTNELISRYESKIYRLVDDPTKIDGKLFDEVEAAEDAYVTARDNATATYNEFTRNPTGANAKLYHAAQDAADNADRAAKQIEYKVAEKTLKGNKDVKQIRELDKMADNADLYQMDAIDASMLSGTGTFLRNFVNSAVGGVEETLFGGGASRLARRVTGQKVGGGIGRGTVKGFGEGVDNLRSVAGARASNAGKNPLKHLKNWATTGNQLGDTVIDSQVKHNVLDHYKQILKEQGYTGRELADRASVTARQDPDNLAREYAGAARVSAGLGKGVTRGNKVETLVKNLVSDAVSAGKPTSLSEATGKLVARMTIGFPTAIGRSTVEGVKRFTLGAPTFIKAIRETDPAKRALLVKEGIKQAGTGSLVVPPMFYALGASGMISGAYPADKETRAQWEREGKTENSIKIGGAWYQLPAYLGAWAVPGLFYAGLGRSGGNWSEASADVAKAIPSLLPTDQASNILDVVNGRTDLGKFMAQTGAGTVRAVTPAGALLNQISKSLDPTKNDTNSGTNLENFFDKVASGIPGVNSAAGIPDKVDDAGNSISNPNPLEVFAGAASDVQTAGEERSRQIQSQTDSTLQKLTDRGLLDDPNIKEVLDDKQLAIYNKVKSGKPLKEGELEDLEKAFTKGVSSTGDDTAYLEREQYDSNLRALQLKREQMEADKTTKPSDLKKMDQAIKRGEVYKDNNTPYDLISDYQGIGVEEWRKMGIGPNDENYDPDVYNPEMYQKLWDIDQKLTKAGVSYRKGALDKNKYFLKEDVKGKGKGSKSIDTSFGTLKAGSFAPQVQQYDTIDAKSGSIPHIGVVRPNIVHKISSSG